MKGKKLKVAGIIGVALIGMIMLGGYVYGYIYGGNKWDSNPTYYFYRNFDVWIGKGVGTELKGAWEYAKKGADTWNDVSDCDFELKYGGKKWNWGGYRDNVNTVDAWVQTVGSGSGSGDRDSTAITWTWSIDSKTLEVDTNFNYKFAWSAEDTCPSDKYDVQQTATHEFGHWLRLKDLYDFSDASATMYGYGMPGATYKRSLTPDDIDGIKFIYPKAPPPPPPPPHSGCCINGNVGLVLSEKEIAILERLKERLMESPDSAIGKAYLRCESQIEAILRMNPELRGQTKNLIEHFMPDIEAIINGEKGRILDKNDVGLFVFWINEAEKYGSPEFQDRAGQVKGMMKEGVGIKEFLLTPSLSELPEIKEPEPETIKFQTRLLSAYPDLGEAGYHIPFELAETTEVTIKLYNIVGQEVKVLNLGSLGPGSYTGTKAVYWNKTNNQGSKVSKGLYFCKFQAGKVSQTEKILISK